MVKKTVQSIRDAELKATEIEQDARLKRDAILQEADAEAKRIISNAAKSALEDAEKAYQKINQENLSKLEKAIESSNKEVEFLHELAKTKKQKAMDLILSEII